MPDSPRVERPPTAFPESLRGIHAVRRSLGFRADDDLALRRVGERVSAEIEGWVERFHERNLADPVAAPLLRDEATALRIRRSLVAWFHELFTLPHDETYEKTRAGIGQAHVRIGMPQHLMVTAMSALRRDVMSTLRARFPPDEVEAAVAAVGKALDLELALMLEAYRREARALARRQGRAVFAEQATRRILRTMRDRVDAALCYLEMAMSTMEPDRTEALVRLRDILRGMSGPRSVETAGAPELGAPPRRTRIAEVCSRAVDNVNFGPGTRVEINVLPGDLEMTVHEEALDLALEELFHNALAHAPASTIRLVVHKAGPGRAVFEVMDEGPGWAPGVRQVEDLHAIGNGIGLALCELVCSLHRGRLDLFSAPGGGAGVRMTVRDAGVEEEGP